MDELEQVLTTIDNPFNPKTHYDEWQEWDHKNGYYTDEFIARLMVMEGDFDVDDEMRLTELRDKVIHDILEHDVLEVYMLV